MDSLFAANREFVRRVLINPFDWEWSVQGFGMLRTYLDANKRFRLNIWDSNLAVPDVSLIHNHPWDFYSYIISGKFTNVRYFKDPNGDEYDWMVIKTGEGGGPDGRSGTIRMSPAIFPQCYHQGDVYNQESTEIHKSMYTNGTVTLNDRTPKLDSEHAVVFWPHGESWVDAEPRPATTQEIAATCQNAFRLFDQ
jgi:hypothetical protein